MGMPLLHIGGEHIERAGIDYTIPHMFAGSILDLEKANRGLVCTPLG